MIDSRYGSTFHQIYSVIHESLSSDDIDKILKLQKSKKLNDIVKANNIDINEVVSFIKSTPAERLKKKKWTSNSEKLLVIKYCSLFQLKSTMLLYNTVSMLPEDGSYRGVVGEWVKHNFYFKSENITFDIRDSSITD